MLESGYITFADSERQKSTGLSKYTIENKIGATRTHVPYIIP